VTKISCLALEFNCSKIELLVEKNNPARAFYEKFGFSETADRVYSISSENFKNLARLISALPKIKSYKVFILIFF